MHLSSNCTDEPYARSAPNLRRAMQKEGAVYLHPVTTAEEPTRLDQKPVQPIKSKKTSQTKHLSGDVEEDTSVPSGDIRRNPWTTRWMNLAKLQKQN